MLDQIKVVVKMVEVRGTNQTTVGISIKECLANLAADANLLKDGGINVCPKALKKNKVRAGNSNQPQNTASADK